MMFTTETALRDTSQKYINARKSIDIIVLTNSIIKAEDFPKLVNTHITIATIINDIVKCFTHKSLMDKYCS